MDTEQVHVNEGTENVKARLSVDVSKGTFTITGPLPKAVNVKENAKGNGFVTVACESVGTFAVEGHGVAFRNAFLNLGLREVKPGAKSDAETPKTTRRFTFGRK